MNLSLITLLDRKYLLIYAPKISMDITIKVPNPSMNYCCFYERDELGDENPYFAVPPDIKKSTYLGIVSNSYFAKDKFFKKG